MVGSIGDMTISILNVYAPIFKNIANVIASSGKRMILIGGDFNTVQNEEGSSTNKSRVLNNVMKELV